MTHRILGIAAAIACSACATTPAQKAGAPAPDAAPAAASTAVAPARPAGADALAAGQAAYRAGELARAEEHLSTAAASAPADARPLVALAELHVSQRRFAEAIADLDRAVALGENARVLALRGRALGLARRFDDAARDLERAVALDPALAEGWATRVAVEVNRGDQVEAERAFAALLQRLGKTGAEDRAWTELLALVPDPVAPQETLDRCTRGVSVGLAGEWIEAERELRNALRFAPGHAWCGAQWAESLGRIGELVRAEQAFRTAIAAFPEAQAPLRADAQSRLAAVLVSSRRNADEAVQLARSAVAARGDRAAPLFVLGRACELAADEACAGDAFQRTLALPHVPDAMRAAASERLSSRAPAAR